MYSSRNGLALPSLSSTIRSFAFFKSFSEGMSSLTSTFPTKSSSVSPFSRTGVWLDGENGGVVVSTEGLGSAAAGSSTSALG